MQGLGSNHVPALFRIFFLKKKLFLSGQLQYPCTKNRMGGALGLAAGLPPNTDHVFSRYKRMSALL